MFLCVRSFVIQSEAKNLFSLFPVRFLTTFGMTKTVFGMTKWGICAHSRHLRNLRSDNPA